MQGKGMDGWVNGQTDKRRRERKHLKTLVTRRFFKTQNINRACCQELRSAGYTLL